MMDERNDECLHAIQTDIKLIQQDLHSVKETVETNGQSNAERLRDHGRQIDELTIKVATMEGKTLGSNNLGSFVLSAAIVIVMILQIFFN